MATQIGALIEDQFSNAHIKGGARAPVGGKNISKAEKKAGLGLGGRRKALIDISNSGKPSEIHLSKKNNSMNVISIEEDQILASKSNKSSAGGKAKAFKPHQEKTQARVRKPLGDLTNSRKLSEIQTTKKSFDKKVNEENLPNCIAEEGFLHDHQKCISAQKRGIDSDYFHEIIGLHNDITMKLESPWELLSSKNSKIESPSKEPELLDEDEFAFTERKRPEYEIDSPGHCGSPKSPTLPLMDWMDHDIPDFVLIDSS